MSATTVDLLDLLGDDPTFDENDEPLATQHHRDVIDSLYYSLRERLAGPDVSVAAELRIYRSIAAVRAREFREPDLLVALERADDERLIYLLSEEGKAPDFVLEVLSETTHAKDTGEKRRWYREIGVREYVVVDLEGKYAGERRLQRWRLEGEEPGSDVPPEVGREGDVLAAGVLPYGLVVRDAWARWVDPPTGEELPLLREELAQGRQEAALRRAAQAEARDELERRLAAEAEARIELERRLAAQAEAREELERRLAAEAGRQAAEVRLSDAEARQRAAEARAAAEAAARLVAEEEITRLRRALEHRGGRDDAR
jgi:Uma2 family endonuclease